MTVAIDCAEMYEYIRAALLLNESESFAVIEPFYGSCYLVCHLTNLSIQFKNVLIAINYFTGQ